MEEKITTHNQTQSSSAQCFEITEKPTVVIIYLRLKVQL